MDSGGGSSAAFREYGTFFKAKKKKIQAFAFLGFLFRWISWENADWALTPTIGKARSHAIAPAPKNALSGIGSGSVASSFPEWLSYVDFILFCNINV